MFKFNNYQAVVITCDKQKRYLTGYSASGYLVITGQEKFYVTDMRYFSACERACQFNDYKVVVGKDYSFLFELAKDRKYKKIGVDFTKVTLLESKELKKCALLYDISQEIAELMLYKRPDELAKIKKACQITQKCYLSLLSEVKEGVTERELQGNLIQKFLSNGAEDVSFEPIIAFGANSAVPHHQTSLTKLRQNQPILFDIGCVVDGYCSDFTRTVFFGEPTKEFINVYDLVNEAYDESFNNIVEGTTCQQADAYARAVLDRENLPFIHSLGHGVGVYVHEMPYLSKASKQVLKNNMTFTIEPGAYLDGKFGVRTENTCYLNNGKVNNFYTLGRELLIIENDKIRKY